MLSKGLKVLVAATLLASVTLGRAVLLSVSFGDFRIDKLGWDGTQPGDFDILEGYGLNGTLNVPYGVPTPFDSHDLVVEVGYNASAPWTPPPYSISYSVTIEGVTQTVTRQINVNIGSTDDIHILGTSAVFHTAKGVVRYVGDPVSFVGLNLGRHYGKLPGTLEVVPEPATLALGAAGFATAFLRRRRR
ncbi:MAG: PEP-CTERM sorting domain-containing protein [Fimbriimonadales bacterium]|nr:PEP-CTERM sorting domain-containing protein [Fimbriimonadales bacterium]